MDAELLFVRVVAALYNPPVPLAVAMEWDEMGRAAWESCDDACALCSLADALGFRDTLRAIAACGRTTLHLVPPRETRPRTAVETMEAWLRGEASDDALYEARRHVPYDVRNMFVKRWDLPAVNATRACSTTSAMYAAHYAVAAFVCRTPRPLRTAKRAEANLALCDAIRAAVPCPTVADLLRTTAAVGATPP